MTLTDALVRGYLPTPTARDWRSGKASAATHAKNARPLSEIIGGTGTARLNPQFVEWMMGYPLDYTRIDGNDWRPLATRSCRRSLKPSDGQSCE